MVTPNLEYYDSKKSEFNSKLKNNKYSLAFKYFKEGKTPLDVVMDCIADPNEAKKLYDQFNRLLSLQSISPQIPKENEIKKIKLSSEEWKKAFEAYNKGLSPIELVIEKNFDPEKAEYAYIKFLELNEKYQSITDHEWALAFYFFNKGYKPIDLATRGILDPKKSEIIYKKFLELKNIEKNGNINKEPILNEPKITSTSFLDFEVPDKLVLLFFIASVLVDFEHILASIVYVKIGTFGPVDVILNFFTSFLGPQLGTIISMILMVFVLGVTMFSSAYYLEEKYQPVPFIFAIVFELACILSHIIYLMR